MKKADWQHYRTILWGAIAVAFVPVPLWAQTLTPEELKLPPERFEESPVLERWSQEVPNVLGEIRQDPSFKTRWRLGYSYFSNGEDRGGISVGVEDVFLQPRLPLTFSADFHTTFDGDRQSGGVRGNYYLLPLGGYVNLAPTVGYEFLSGEKYDRQGLAVGAKIVLNLSRSGASTVSLGQQFVNLGDSEEMGITTLGAGYAINSQFRVSTEIQKHNSSAAKESRVGFFLEWQPR